MNCIKLRKSEERLYEVERTMYVLDRLFEEISTHSKILKYKKSGKLYLGDESITYKDNQLNIHTLSDLLARCDMSIIIDTSLMYNTINYDDMFDIPFKKIKQMVPPLSQIYSGICMYGNVIIINNRKIISHLKILAIMSI